MSSPILSRVFKTLSRRKALCLYLIAICGPSAFGQGVGPSNVRGAQKTTFVSCWDESGKNYNSALTHGPILVAPDGLHRAYAEVRAEAAGMDSEGVQQCQNQTTLFIATDGKTFKPVFEYKAAKGEAPGNGIQLIDWSPDSNVLVADLLTWYYSSEGWEHKVLIYSAQSRTAREQSLEVLFSTASSRQCNLGDAELLGFIQDGRVAVRALPADAAYGEPSCVTAEKVWAIDLSTFKLSLIPELEAVKRNGRLEESR